ncbi:MAG: phosphopantetheine-binding protein [Candidatus Thorarchaeota archaeon]
MKTDEIAEKIKEIIIDVLEADIPFDEIDNEEMLLDGQLGIDSLAVIQIIDQIEDSFEISISEEEISSDILSSIDTLTFFISEKINQN